MPKRKRTNVAIDEALDTALPLTKSSPLRHTKSVVNNRLPSRLHKKDQIKKDTGEELVTASNRTPRKQKVRHSSTVVVENLVAKDSKEQLPKAKREVQNTVKGQKVEQESDGVVVEKKVVRKRKTKEEKEAEAMPLATRTVGHKLFIGAHVSSAGGVHNSVSNAVHIGANAFALFLKSQRKWANPPLIEDHCLAYRDSCTKHTYDQGSHVVPHGSYLVNLAHTDETRIEQAYDAYVDDLKRCERLGIKLYNIHPGNAASSTRSEAIAQLANNINRAHAETNSVITLLENMATVGNTIGGTFEDLRDTIALVKDKKRVGVCLDTCHAFAAGYDLRSPNAFKETMNKFDEVVGLTKLKALHVNDSKAPFCSNRDLHANIGTGFLGLRAFHNIVNEPRFEGLPMVLETPIEIRDEGGNLVKNDKGKEIEDKGIWAKEIKMLEALVGMDVDGEEFLKMEKELARKGEPERKRVADQFERKKEKVAKEGKKKGKKRHRESEESELSDLAEDD